MSQPSLSPPNNEDVIFPRDRDIIIARGSTHLHTGNGWFRTYIEELSSGYHLLTKTEKSAFVADVLRKITEDDRKFYMRLSKNNYSIVDIQDRFNDGHSIIHNKIRQRLNISSKVAAATTKAAAIVNRNSNDYCGKYLYFQTMTNHNRGGHLRMNAPVAEKNKFRDILSEADGVISQTNICIDPNYQMYLICALHEKPHAVEDNCNREQYNQILQNQHGSNIIEMKDNEINGSGVQKVPGVATNYTSKSVILRNLVTKSFPLDTMKELAMYILENGEANKNRDEGDDSKRIYMGFGQVQTSSKRYCGEKMPTFNSTHLKKLPPRLRVALANVMNFSQPKLQEFLSATTKETDRSTYVKKKWQQFFNADNVNVDWEFEFVDINIRSFGKLVRHCDYKNDWRINHDGCAVFSYSVDIDSVTYRVVMVMTSRYSIGASFENVYTKKTTAKKTKVVKKAKSTLRKQCKKKR